MHDAHLTRLDVEVEKRVCGSFVVNDKVDGARRVACDGVLECGFDST